MGISQRYCSALGFFLLISVGAWAENPHHPSPVFHAFWLEAQHGGGSEGGITDIELDGWIGGDTNKLWLKTDIKQHKGALQESEFWAMYSRNVSEFWDFQTGIRLDTQPDSTGYFTLGVNGLAPYFLKTQAHLFVSDYGDITARLKQSTHLLVTQRMGIEPYYRLEMAAQRVARQSQGQGLTNGRLGVRFNYEITREWSPYVDFRYDWKFGGTSSIANNNDERRDHFTLSLGVALMF